MNKTSWLSLIVLFSLVGCGEVPKQPEPAIVVSAHEEVLTEVRITSEGFEPAILTVPQGTTVTWINTDTASHWVATDPHPHRSGLAGFDSGLALEPNQQFSYTFSKRGDWVYHDHLRPVTYTGKIVVTD